MGVWSGTVCEARLPVPCSLDGLDGRLITTNPRPPCLAQDAVHGLKAAAAALLLSADAGMGPATSVLGLAKEALDAIMKMQ